MTRTAIAVLGLWLAGSGVCRAQVRVLWFYTEGCPRCEDVKRLVAGIEERFAGRAAVERLELTVPANYRRLREMERTLAVTDNAPMVAFVDDAHLSGHERILSGLESTVALACARAASGGSSEPAAEATRPAGATARAEAGTAGDDGIFARVRPWLVIGAGLADGINPCAFATVVFLISLLGARAGGPRRTWSAGLAFAAGVFVAYFLIGLGAASALRRLRGFSVASDVLYWAVAGATLLLGAISARDAWVYARGGGAGRIWLKVPGALRQRSHGALRTATDARHVAAGCFAAGLVVSLLEVVCTGQIYFPTIMVMIREGESRAAGLAYLCLYNIAFIAPLTAVVALFAAGQRVDPFLRLSRRSFVGSKIALAALFLLLGAVLAAMRLRQ